MKERSDGIKQQVLGLVERLPVSSVYELYNLVGISDNPESDRLALVKLTFIEYLNNLRPHRARRLFTDLFTPLLVNDNALLRTKKAIPGSMQRADAAGLWHAFSRYGFPELTIEVQEALDDLCRNTLLDQVLRTPEAAAMKNRMRLAAVRYVDELLGNTNNLNSFLSYINKRRLAEAKKKALYLDEVYPLDRNYMVFCREYLANADEFERFLRREMPPLERGGQPEWQLERNAEALADSVDHVRDVIIRGPCRSEVPFLLALALLHQRRRYDLVAMYVRQVGVMDCGPVVEALISHFAAACADMIQILTGALKLGERIAGASIKLTHKEREEVDGELRRVGELLPAMVVGSILENRQTEPMFRLVWNDLARFLSDRIATVATQRLVSLLTARNYPVLDHRDVVWMVGLVWTWHRIAQRYGQNYIFFDKWRDQVVEDIRIATEQAARFEPMESLPDRMQHLLRINEVASIFDISISGYLSVSSQNITRMVKNSLLQTEPMAPGELVFVGEFLAMSRAEVGRNKNWRSPELQDLLQVAEERGL